MLVMTDKNLATLPTFRVLLDALTREGVDYEVWDETRVEPTDARLFLFLFLFYYYILLLLSIILFFGILFFGWSPNFSSFVGCFDERGG